MIDEKDVNEQPTKLELASDKLDKKTEKLATKIVRQTNPDEIKDLVSLFNLNHTKKQILRTMTYDQLLDSITDQMKERVLKRADQFSNKDLLDYLNTMNTAMEKAHKQINEIDAVPAIQVNQQNNTVIMGEGLDRESRQRVFEFVKNVLNKSGDLKNIPAPIDISDQITVLNSEDEIEELNEDTTLDNLYEIDSEEDESFNINTIKFNEE